MIDVVDELLESGGMRGHPIDDEAMDNPIDGTRCCHGVDGVPGEGTRALCWGSKLS